MKINTSTFVNELLAVKSSSSIVNESIIIILNFSPTSLIPKGLKKLIYQPTCWVSFWIQGRLSPCLHLLWTSHGAVLGEGTVLAAHPSRLVLVRNAGHGGSGRAFGCVLSETCVQVQLSHYIPAIRAQILTGSLQIQSTHDFTLEDKQSVRPAAPSIDISAARLSVCNRTEMMDSVEAAVELLTWVSSWWRNVEFFHQHLPSASASAGWHRPPDSCIMHGILKG